MRHFPERRQPKPGEVPVSVKLRVSSGYFGRYDSPRAFALIDLQRSALSDPGFTLDEEHETGPELLAYMALGTAGLMLAKSIVDLIIAIIKARSEGIAKGDRPSGLVELIVRRTDECGGEELVLRLGPRDAVSDDLISKCLHEALEKIVQPNPHRRGGEVAPAPTDGGPKRSRRRKSLPVS